jgi:hypothetical protein
VVIGHSSWHEVRKGATSSTLPRNWLSVTLAPDWFSSGRFAISEGTDRLRTTPMDAEGGATAPALSRDAATHQASRPTAIRTQAARASKCRVLRRCEIRSL